MNELTPWQRFVLAFVAFFSVLFRRDFALRVARVREELRGLPEGRAPAASPPVPAEPLPPAPKAWDAAAMPAAAPVPRAEPDVRPALQVLSLLQREGRLVDFVEEDLTGFSDAQIGAAARTVHAGCKRVIDEHFRLEPVYRDPEGASVTVQPGFDASSVRLTGNVVGSAPFRGALRHHGWLAREVKLPALPDGQDPKVVAPAEVEL